MQKEAFNILLQIGAGTKLLFLLRWFWWRINAYSKIVAMIVALVLAIYFEMILPKDVLLDYQKLLIYYMEIIHYSFLQPSSL